MNKKPTPDAIANALGAVDLNTKPAGSVVKSKKPEEKPAETAKKIAANKAAETPKNDARLNVYCTKAEHEAIRIESVLSGRSNGQVLLDALRATGFFDKKT